MLKAINEIALLALLAQGILYLFAGAKRDTNPIYFLFKTITSPIMKLTRTITPRIVIDQHIGFVALFILLAAEVALIAAKIYLYLEAAGR
jgi:uncharacterized protein YggT (Ycf19 family)